MISAHPASHCFTFLTTSFPPPELRSGLPRTDGQAHAGTGDDPRNVLLARLLQEKPGPGKAQSLDKSLLVW